MAVPSSEAQQVGGARPGQTAAAPSGDDPAPSQRPEGAQRPLSITRALAAAGPVAWRFVGCAAALAVVAYVLGRLRLVLLPAVVALFAATVLAPPAAWLRARRWPPLAAAWATVLGAAVVLGAAGYAIVPQVVAEVDDVGSSVSAGVDEVEEWLREGPLGLSGDDIDRYLDQARERVRANGDVIADRAVSGGLLVLEVAAGFLLTIALVFFFVKDGDRFVAWVLGQVDEARARDLRALGRAVWRALGSYVRGTAVVGLVDAAVIGVGLALLGVPLVVPLALFTFLGAFFPLVGAVVAGAVAALVALVSEGPTTALLVVGLTVVVQQLEGDLVAPLVVGRAVRLHPAVVLVVLTAGGVLAGLVGAFLAVPVAAVVAAAARHYRTPYDERVRGAAERS